jgi:hypothetical protein
MAAHDRNRETTGSGGGVSRSLSSMRWKLPPREASRGHAFHDAAEASKLSGEKARPRGDRARASTKKSRLRSAMLYDNNGDDTIAQR